jgi:hypothetical protein
LRRPIASLSAVQGCTCATLRQPCVAVPAAAGRRERGANPDGSASSAWSKANGVEQVFGGAVSPSGSTDIGNDPKLLAFDPIYAAIVKAYLQCADWLLTAANFRYTALILR